MTLIDFTVKNYLSFRDEVTLSMIAGVISKKDDISNLIDVENGRYHGLPFAAVYGPNASGKSNLLKAMFDFQKLIVESHTYTIDKEIPVYRPFKLNTVNQTLPVEFGMEFIANGLRYVYTVAISKYQIESEELIFFPEGRRATLYSRDGKGQISYGAYYKGEKKTIERFLLKNNLLLSRVPNLISEGSPVTEVYRSIRDLFNFHTAMDSSSRPIYGTTLQIDRSEPAFKDRVLDFLRAADFTIESLKIEEDESLLQNITFPSSIPEKIREKFITDLTKHVYFAHPVYSDKNIIEAMTYFSLRNEESSGTVKMYDIAAVVIKTLSQGGILVVDEFNSGLHPFITQYIVDLFNKADFNPKRAQLIVATHDISTLNLTGIRRDQIWFTQKDYTGFSELFSLEEFDKDIVRKDGNFAKWYMEGRFKALPIIDYGKSSKQLSLWE